MPYYYHFFASMEMNLFYVTHDKDKIKNSFDRLNQDNVIVMKLSECQSLYRGRELDLNILPKL